MWLGVICLAVTAFWWWRDSAGAERLRDVAQSAASFRQLFEVAGAGSSLWTVFTPALVCSAVMLAIMLMDPAAGRLSRTLVIIGLGTLYTFYMGYRLFATLNLTTGAQATFSILLFAAECLAYGKTLSSSLQMLWPTDRRAEADRLGEAVRGGNFVPSVDVFIPTYSEPVEILRRTIIGCQALRYPRLQIYLLDDQRRPAMRALAEELGCNYCDRPDNRHAKAGNMNAAVPRSSGELIAIFDADFVPTRDFLERTVGFFADPKVGLVQTPQNFYSVDAVSRNLGLPGVITEEQQVFFRATQPGRDAFGAIICHGTSFVIRRSALQAIGGFPGETLSEDWATSVKLQSAGYRTVYLNELVSAGAAAEFTSEFVTQRLRWARGTLQCFSASTNPLTVPGLTPMQRLIHLCGPLHYLAFLTRLLFLVLPLFYFWFGLLPFVSSLELLAVFLLPYWCCQTLTLSWLTRGHRSAFWSEVYDTMLCVPMCATIVSTFWDPFGKPFKVSAKGQTASSLRFNPVVGVPLLILIALYTGTLLAAWAGTEWRPDPGAIVLPMICAIYVLVVLWLSLLASLDVPQQTAVPSFSRSWEACLEVDGKRYPMRTTEISENGTKLEPGQSGTIAELVDGREGKLTLESRGVTEFPVTLHRDAAGKLRADWKELSAQQSRDLVIALYCQPGQWNPRGVPEAVTFWHFLQAPFRMHALADAR